MKDIDITRLQTGQAAPRRPQAGNGYRRDGIWLSLGLVGVWALCLVAGIEGERDKLVGISLMAWLAMVLGIGVAVVLPRAARWVAWADGLVAGAMVASACLFLLPMAMHAAPDRGAIGITAGLLVGSLLHVWARQRHLDGHAADASLTAITLHAVGAGIVIGLIYARMPSLGWLLGVAIVSHKLPAGYALARRRIEAAQSLYPVLWPACAVGLLCVPIGLWVPAAAPADNAVLAGFATGLFMYVGLDFSRPAEGDVSTISWPAFIAALAVGAVLVAGLKYIVTP